jgi:hypothetical protein
MSSPRFFQMRVLLDTKFNRSSADLNFKHWVGSTFKSFAVIGTNNAAFKLKIIPDARGNGAEKGLPLYDGFYHNFVRSPNDAVFENEVAQPGVWVDVLISVEDEINLGSVKAPPSTLTIPYKGPSYTMEARTVTTTIAELIPANDQRSEATLMHKSGGSIWIGKPADLANADFKNICAEIKPGGKCKWENFSSLSAKTEAGSTVFSLTQEFII